MKEQYKAFKRVRKTWDFNPSPRIKNDKTKYSRKDNRSWRNDD